MEFGVWASLCFWDWCPDVDAICLMVTASVRMSDTSSPLIAIAHTNCDNEPTCVGMLPATLAQVNVEEWSRAGKGRDVSRISELEET